MARDRPSPYGNPERFFYRSAREITDLSPAIVAWRGTEDKLLMLRVAQQIPCPRARHLFQLKRRMANAEMRLQLGVDLL